MNQRATDADIKLALANPAFVAMLRERMLKGSLREWWMVMRPELEVKAERHLFEISRK